MITKKSEIKMIKINKSKNIIVLGFLFIFLLIPLASAVTIDPTVDKFSFRNGAYLTLTSTATATYTSAVITGNYVNFTSLVYNGGNPVDLSISSPNNIILTGASNSSINYTAPAGTSTLQLSAAPSSVTINGTESVTAWTYIAGVLTVLTTGTDDVVVNLVTTTPVDTGSGPGDPNYTNPTLPPTSTPLPSDSPLITPNPTNIIDNIQSQPLTYILVIGALCFLFLLVAVEKKSNNDKKLKQSLQPREWKNPL